jgi:ketosteroid isomerase-like protein
MEIVRRVYDAAARRDRATVLALYDPEVELDLSRIPLAGLTGQGTWYEAFEPYEEDCEELIDTGEHVISVVTGWGRGRASGTDVEHPFVLAWTLREGRVVRVVWSPTRAEAFEAVEREE